MNEREIYSKILDLFENGYDCEDIAAILDLSLIEVQAAVGELEGQ